jgi:excisionase family DNA binding protein
MPNTSKEFCSLKATGFLSISNRKGTFGHVFAECCDMVMRAAICGKRPVGAANMTPPSVSSPLALRPREAAKALGISPRLLWQLTKDGQIPCVRVGSRKRKTVLYPLADLQAWLTRQAATAKEGERGAQ